MKEYICLNCHRVFRAGELYSNCCGKTEEFLLEKHGTLLVSSSNSWIDVYKKWKNNEIVQEISYELNKEGCYSASAVINEFIQRLIESQQGE
ncbi:MAG: hypothetical protein WA061_02575 [Microgenomates group bacterium]